MASTGLGKKQAAQSFLGSCLVRTSIELVLEGILCGQIELTYVGSNPGVGVFELAEFVKSTLAATCSKELSGGPDANFETKWGRAELGMEDVEAVKRVVEILDLKLD